MITGVGFSFSFLLKPTGGGQVGRKRHDSGGGRKRPPTPALVPPLLPSI